MGEGTGRVNEGLIDIADDNYLDDVHGEGVGDAEAVMESGLGGEGFTRGGAVAC